MIVGLSRDLAKIKLSTSTNKDAEYRRAIFYALKRRGGVYMKCLQVLAVTQKFLDGWAGPAEMTVFDRLEAEEVKAERYVEMGNFIKFSEKPVATGSFAVVYRATLMSGEEVAVKILRPSIERRLKSDLKQLKMVARMLSRFLPKSILDYNTVIGEFARTCLLETDYGREVENMEYFQKFYQGHPYVKIPKVYKVLCRKNVIVQEWIEGDTFASILAERSAGKPATALALERTGSNLWTQMIVAGGEAVRMAMCADFVFGDPHPGNIKLLADNKIAFIDFGIVASRPTSRKAFYDWVGAYRNVLMGKTAGVAKLAEATIMCFCPDVAMALRGCDMDGESAMEKILAGVRDKTNALVRSDVVASDLFANGHLFRLFTEVLDGNNSLGLRLDMSNFQLVKAMQAYLGSMTVLDNSETHDKFAGAMLAAMNYALEYAEKVGIENDLPVRSKYSRGENLEILIDTMSSLADGNEFLFEYLQGRR